MSPHVAGAAGQTTPGHQWSAVSRLLKPRAPARREAKQHSTGWWFAIGSAWVTLRQARSPSGASTRRREQRSCDRNCGGTSGKPPTPGSCTRAWATESSSPGAIAPGRQTSSRVRWAALGRPARIGPISLHRHSASGSPASTRRRPVRREARCITPGPPSTAPSSRSTTPHRPRRQARRGRCSPAATSAATRPPRSHLRPTGLASRPFRFALTGVGSSVRSRSLATTPAVGPARTSRPRRPSRSSRRTSGTARTSSRSGLSTRVTTSPPRRPRRSPSTTRRPPRRLRPRRSSRPWHPTWRRSRGPSPAGHVSPITQAHVTVCRPRSAAPRASPRASGPDRRPSRSRTGPASTP